MREKDELKPVLSMLDIAFRHGLTPASIYGMIYCLLRIFIKRKAA